MKPRLLVVVSPGLRHEFKGVSRLADVKWFDELGEEELRDLLPTVDCMFIHFWTKALYSERLAAMRKLRFVQYGLAGVDGIPIRLFGKKVMICSNAGGYSQGVGEYAFALLIAAAKKIVRDDIEIKSGTWKFKEPFERGKNILVLKGKKLGVIGYGGIGRAVGSFAKGFGMEIAAFSRKRLNLPGVTSYAGKEGLARMLGRCDAFVLSLPLTKKTNRLIGANELSMMKKNAVLVNIARGELIEEKALYDHLRHNPDFVYATDVWWVKDGRELIPSELPFTSLSNFIGTPHTAGPSSLLSGEPVRHAVENLTRYLRGEKPQNVVDRSEYF
jgi:phosphoglycerate dehydrogenase-like enzyme